jgi:ribosomal protein L5
MKNYTFNVKKLDGTVVSITIEATNYRQARALLNSRQLPESQKVQKGQF